MIRTALGARLYVINDPRVESATRQQEPTPPIVTLKHAIADFSPCDGMIKRIGATWRGYAGTGSNGPMKRRSERHEAVTHPDSRTLGI